MIEFSFDEWAKLYENNPIEFENRRTSLLDETIRSAPIEHRAKLRLLQVECDGIRHAMDPMEATIAISEMMIRKLNELKTPLTQLRSICEDIVNPE